MESMNDKMLIRTTFAMNFISENPLYKSIHRYVPYLEMKFFPKLRVNFGFADFWTLNVVGHLSQTQQNVYFLTIA